MKNISNIKNSCLYLPFNRQRRYKINIKWNRIQNNNIIIEKDGVVLENKRGYMVTHSKNEWIKSFTYTYHNLQSSLLVCRIMIGAYSLIWMCALCEMISIAFQTQIWWNLAYVKIQFVFNLLNFLILYEQ